jgi:hypothetical protein
VVRLAIVVAMSVFWFAFANHCELAAMLAPKPSQTHNCCKQQQTADTAPLKGDQQNRAECCKGFHPAVLSIGQEPASPNVFPTPLCNLVTVIVFPDALHTADIAEVDTGPPFASSFAEVVLQRSLLAHAPPSLI